MALILQPPTHPSRGPVRLPDRLAALGRARRRAAAGAAALALVGTVAAALAVVGAADARWHLPPLARGFALVATLAAGGILVRRLRAALRLRTDALSVALALEARHPKLNDALASAVAFLEDADDRGVSRRLRHAAVRRAERVSGNHDLGAIVPRSRAMKALAFCAAALLAAVPAALVDTDRAATAAVRFADPFGPHPWPARTRIELVTPSEFPSRLPKPDPFEFQFVVRGVLPDRAHVAFRLHSGEEFDEAYPLTAADPRTPGSIPQGVSPVGPLAVVSARVEPARLNHDFDFRVTAGDGDTGWLHVAVVPPPRLVPLDGRPSPQLHVTPPEYTGQRLTELPDGAAVVEVPAGTTVRLRAAADVPLGRAVLAFQGDRSAVERAAPLAHLGRLDSLGAAGSALLADALGDDVPLALSGDGRVMWAEFTPAFSGMYALRLTDPTGLTGVRLLEIRLTPDPAPNVSLLRPAPGRDPTRLVPTANLRVDVLATDRVYGLRRTFLEYRVGAAGRIRTVPLADYEPTSRALPAAVGAALANLPPQPPEYDAAFVLNLSRFLRDDGTPVRAGDVLYLRAAADDWDTVTVLKEPGRSRTEVAAATDPEEAEVEPTGGWVVIRVGSPEAVDGFIHRRLAELRRAAQRVREEQREATDRAAVRPQADGSLGPADREKLLAAGNAQDHVRNGVAGLRQKVELLDDLARSNGLPKSPATDRLAAAAGLLRPAEGQDAAAVDRHLAGARDQIAEALRQPPTQPLARAARHQRGVEDTLTDLIDLLNQWGGAAELRGDARQLRDTVLREADTADRLPDRVPPGKAADALTPEQRAELDRAAARLDRLADQAGALLGKARNLAAEKDQAAAAAKAAAASKEADASALDAKAGMLPQGSEARSAAAAKAEQARLDAADATAASTRAAAEAAAIRAAVAAAGGQAVPDELRQAAVAARENRQGEAGAKDRSAAARLDRFANGLAEQQPENVPELSRRQRADADQADATAAAQDDLQKRAAEAARVPDATKRGDELRRLAPEQQKLAEQTRDLVQRLTRDRADDAAKDARAALEKMEAARDSLENGADPTAAQRDATAKLDDARDRLDGQTARAEERLADETRRRLAAQVTALLDRQKAAITEAGRVQEAVLKGKAWTRPLLASLSELEDRERALAGEVRGLADREFAQLAVFARIVNDAADAMDKAGDKAKARRQDALDADPDAAFDPALEKANHDRVARPMGVAVRRLEQVLEALKEDQPKAGRAPMPTGTPPTGMPMPMPMPAGNADAIPPLAQLRALRALQNELNERTAAFAKANPDPAALSDDAREELAEIEAAQRRLAELFAGLAAEFRRTPEEMP
ncbi:hypothetical protein [Urbifossiella limnaea]|uniref:hypothetical protein n=1 Tax=Urbifossiella limnaea TaxID=2528023 RepID=UPI0011A3EB2E|nr:hypothetical protein [Urbifossiella limnaea]